MKNFITLILFSILFQYAEAQNPYQPDTAQRIFRVQAITSALTIDGKLNEPEWKKTHVSQDFIQLEPLQGEASKFKTEVRGVYNNKYLYIGFYCYSTDGKNRIRVPDLKRDFSYRQHDMVAICFDGFNDKRNSMTFACNALGAQKDYLAYDDTFFDSDWNGLWKVRTSQTEDGWSAEFEIPWKTLRYQKSPDSCKYNFNINFLRVMRSHNEISVWSPYPRAFGFNRMEFAGKMEGMAPPENKINIQVNPYSLTTVTSRKGTDVANEQLQTFKQGGDVKWAFNSKTVLDLTYNTDFAQADADQIVNNISRFSVFFPEKRQFFLENASLFGVGLLGEGENGQGGSMYLQPFFSRRIGLDENGTPIPISFGSRIVHRNSKMAFGSIFLRQSSKDQNPEQNVFIVRHTENIGKANRIGGIFSLKNSESLNEKKSYNSYSYAVDGFFRYNSKLSLNTLVAQTFNTLNHRYGNAAFAQFNYNTNEITAWWTHTYIDNNYNPELGFISRSNTMATCPGIIFNIRRQWIPFKKVIRSYNPSVQAQIFHKANSLDRQETIVSFYPLWFDLHNGGNFLLGTISNFEYIQEDFSPLDITISPGIYRFSRYFIASSSDASKRLSYSAKYEKGGYYDGKLQTLNFALNICPIPNIGFNLNYNLNIFRHVGINDENISVPLYTVNYIIAPNPRIQLSGLYQFNPQNKMEAFTTRLGWEYAPLSYIYLICNKKSQEDSGILTEQSMLFKISFLKQF